MEIIQLIDRSNRMFELLEYTDQHDANDEIVSLKISLNNLLLSLDKDDTNFFEVFMLSSPVLFDFAFNSKVEDVGKRLRSSFEKQANYEEAKKWYKFIRNSLIHTNRYTYNSFIKSVYRIEYDQTAEIYFELNESKSYRYQEFKENSFFIENERCNVEKQYEANYQYENDARVMINYDYFCTFVLDVVTQLVRSIEHDVDSILSSEVSKWNNYYNLYKKMITNVYWDRDIDIKLLRKLVKSLSTLKDFDLEEAYVLCEFLVYLVSLEDNLSEQWLFDIIEITTFDKYYQLENRALLLNKISSIKDYERVHIDFESIVWLLNDIYPLDSNVQDKLQIFDHTNYLIMYVQKYLQTKVDYML